MENLQKKEKELEEKLAEIKAQKEEEDLKQLRKTYVGNYYKILGKDVIDNQERWEMYFYVKDVWDEDTLMCDKIYINLKPKNYENAVHLDIYTKIEFDNGRGMGLIWQAKKKITKKQYIDAFKKAQEHINNFLEDAKQDKWFSETLKKDAV